MGAFGNTGIKGGDGITLTLILIGIGLVSGNSDLFGMAIFLLLAMFPFWLILLSMFIDTRPEWMRKED